jgi:dTDP-4-dehydrorhamnose reductase
MRILVTGSAGQLGKELCRLLGPAALPVDLDKLDLTNRRAVLEAVPAMAPQAVINCAAYTKVDLAQSEPGPCRAINAKAVQYLADACRRLDCPLVQISTDYVFSGADGRREPYREDDPPSPQGVYAVTKLEGERQAAVWQKHLIVRTCGLYSRPSHTEARNFVATIRRLARTKPKLSVVSDQQCTPTYVPHLARAVLFLVGAESGRKTGTGSERSEVPVPLFPPAPWGCYHVTNTGATNWYEFAREIVRLAGSDVVLEPITTAEYGAAAPRPAYSVLDTTAYHRLGGPSMPDWKAALAEYFAEAGLRSWVLESE